MAIYNIRGTEQASVYNIDGNKIVSNKNNDGYMTEPIYKAIDNNPYRLVWQDDFDGNDINNNFWRDVHFISRVTNRYQAWTDYYLENSCVHLRIKADAPNRYLADDPSNDMAVTAIQTGAYNKLHITSPFYHDVNPFWGLLVQEGYIEIKFKTFKGSGTHTAFWGVGIQDGLKTDTPQAEIDIAEILGNNTTNLPHGQHKWDDSTASEEYKTTPVGVDFATDFHVVGLLWKNGSLRWYLDGTQVDEMSLNTPQYPIMLLLTAYRRLSGTGWTGDADPTLGDVEYLVDYIKIYKKATSEATADVSISSVEDLEINGNTQDMTIDSQRGVPICFKSYVYVNWSDGSRTEHWVKWQAVQDTYRNKLTNHTAFKWVGYVYNLGVTAYANITF